jgi:hypothetical protein
MLHVTGGTNLAQGQDFLCQMTSTEKDQKPNRKNQQFQLAMVKLMAYHSKSTHHDNYLLSLNGAHMESPACNVHTNCQGVRF